MDLKITINLMQTKLIMQITARAYASTILRWTILDHTAEEKKGFLMKKKDIVKLFPYSYSLLH